MATLKFKYCKKFTISKFLNDILCSINDLFCIFLQIFPKISKKPEITAIEIYKITCVSEYLLLNEHN